MSGLLLSLAVVAAVEAQGATVFVDGAVDGARLVGGRQLQLRGHAVAFAGLDAGTWTLHFGAGARGKPASLPLLLDADAEAVVAVDRRAPAAGAPETFACVLPAAGGAGGRALVVGDGQRRAARVDVDLTLANGQAGVLLQYQGEADCYRCVVDAAAAEVRLERHLGGDVFVLGRGALPPSPTATHHLTAQADGFRLGLWCDDAPMVLTLDGGLEHGRVGLWAAAGSDAQFARFEVGEPAASAAVIAAVRSADADGVTVAVEARAPQHVGADCWLSLARVPAPGPRLDDVAGMAPFLARGLDALVLPVGASFCGRWRGVHGSVADDGGIAARLRWPDLPLFRERCLLVQLLIVSADGVEILDRLPAVWARM